VRAAQKPGAPCGSKQRSQGEGSAVKEGLRNEKGKHVWANLEA